MIDLDEIERLARAAQDAVTAFEKAPRGELPSMHLLEHSAARRAMDALHAELSAATVLALVARLRAADGVADGDATLVDEFGGSLEMLHRNGPDYTFKNGERVLVASVLEDREEIIEATRSALAAYRALTEKPTP